MYPDTTNVHLLAEQLHQVIANRPPLEGRLVSSWPIRKCSLCGVPFGYVFHPGEVNAPPYFDSSCDCTSLNSGLQRRTWADVALQYIQTPDPHWWGFKEASHFEEAGAELEPPHIFCRLIQAQQFGQFMLRLCYNPEMAGRPRDPEDGDPYRSVTIDSETFAEGALEPQYERAVLIMKGIPAGLFNYRLLALFSLHDCAAWQRVNQGVHSGEYPPVAAAAAVQELTANIVQRVKATYPEYFGQ